MSENYDLVIRGGSIVDGLGSEPRLADVAVKDGVIVAVGSISGKGSEEIDATGKVVTPGFVDVHTHYDGQITWENRLSPSSGHGVTTVVMGNCGVGFAPTKSTDHELVIKLMEGVEDIPEVVMASGVPWNWESFTDYLDALSQREGDVDFAAQIPHSPMRVYVMGERGAALEPPTAEDLAEMRRLTSEAIGAGALGVSTSRNLFHRFRSGELAPSVKTAEDELMALADGLRDAGSGVFQCNPNLDVDVRGELELFERVAERSGRPVNYSMISTPHQKENFDHSIAALKRFAKEGVPITAQFMPRPIGLLFGLDLSYHPFSLNPSYREIANLPLAEKVARMRDPEFKARLLSEEPDDPNPAFVGMIKYARNLFVLPDPADYHPKPEDMIPARAERMGISWEELVYEELLKDEGRAILCSVSIPVLDYIGKTVDLFRASNAVVALGDGGAHYGMVCDAAYTTYVLSQRLGRDGLDLPTIIAALTSKPARSIGLNDRGVVAEGYKADLNVIDLDRLTLRRPTIATDLPAGGKRLTQKAEGYVATIVSGVVTARDGVATGNLPGRLVRGAKPAPGEEVRLAA